LDTLQLPFASIIEGDSGPGHQVNDSAGYEDLSRRGHGHNAGGDMDSDAADVITSQLNLASVDAAAEFEAELAGSVSHTARKANRSRRPVESGERAVTCALHQMAVKHVQVMLDNGR
jgi:hypothetical protein